MNFTMNKGQEFSQALVSLLTAARMPPAPDLLASRLPGIKREGSPCRAFNLADPWKDIEPLRQHVYDRGTYIDGCYLASLEFGNGVSISTLTPSFLVQLSMGNYLFLLPAPHEVPCLDANLETLGLRKTRRGSILTGVHRIAPPVFVLRLKKWLISTMVLSSSSRVRWALPNRRIAVWSSSARNSSGTGCLKVNCLSHPTRPARPPIVLVSVALGASSR